MLKLVKVICWNVPSGFHQAKIVDARLIRKCVNGKEEYELRLIFEITSLVHPTKVYMAKRVYKRGDSAAIIADFDHLLGAEINSVINLAGEIIPDALAILEGRMVDIEIEHHHGKNHDEPFCLVVQVRKPGTLIEDIGEEAA